MRPSAGNGVAFAGDAALAADPLWGVGCGWAFQSAEWLADAAARDERIAYGIHAMVNRVEPAYRVLPPPAKVAA